MRNPTNIEIRTYSDDPSSMKGDPLEGLSKFFDFIAIIFGLGTLTIVIEIIIWIINNI
jgi:hypothetical protein